MALPFSVEKPDPRNVRVVFYTDEETAGWIEGVAKEHDLEVSLVCHRIVTSAKGQAGGPTERERRQGDRRKAG